MKEKSSLVFKAIRLVADAHSGQYRKGTRLPYIVHLVNVMRTLVDLGCEDEIVAAGVLHDVIEDTPLQSEDIEKQFGKRVAFLVKGATEVREQGNGYDEIASWHTRKEHTIRFLAREATEDQLLISCADKLDNITAIKEDYLKMGESLWERFNAGKDRQHWYYTQMAQSFKLRALELGNPLSILSERFSQTVNEVFNDEICYTNWNYKIDQ
ncbi:MAG: HD domain-containing protein [Methylococcaceae bacterium]